MLPSELLALYSQKETELVNTWIVNKGVIVSIKQPDIPLDDFSSQNNDPFATYHQTINYDAGVVQTFKTVENRKAIFVKSNSDNTPITLDMFFEHNKGINTSNINEMYCYIQGDILAKYTEITTQEPYPQIQYRIDDLLSHRPMSNVVKYRLVRN